MVEVVLVEDLGEKERNLSERKGEGWQLKRERKRETRECESEGGWGANLRE